METITRSLSPTNSLTTVPSGEPIPITPRKAEVLARDFVQKEWIVGEWRTRSIVLENLDFEKWIYVVRMTQPKEKDFLQEPILTTSPGAYRPVDIVVLMDGTVVRPKKVQK
jgi:hypothetical protein